MLLGMEVGLSPGDFVLDREGTQPLPQKGRSPTQFLACVYCGQTAAWIKMPLRTVVGHGLRDSDRWQLPSPKGAQPPIFGQCPLWPNGWMD